MLRRRLKRGNSAVLRRKASRSSAKAWALMVGLAVCQGRIPWLKMENHRKIIRKITIIIIAMFGNFMVKFYLNNWFNGLIGFLRFGLV